MDSFLTGNFINFIIIAILLHRILSLVFRFISIGLWLTAYFSGVRVGLFTLVGMRLRRVSPHEIIRPQIKATKAGLDLSIDELEAHYLAGGNINDIIDALIASERANIALSFEKAAAIEDRKSTRLNSSHVSISYAVFCLKKKI